MQWKHMLQLFEFEYPQGFLFWDRAGVVARRLCDRFPQLRFKNSAPEQKDFVSADGDVEVFYGVRIAGLRRQGELGPDFSEMAGGLHKILVQDLILQVLTGFRMCHIVARPLSEAEEREKSLFALMPALQKEVAASGSTVEPLAFQVEMLATKPLRMTVRVFVAPLESQGTTGGNAPQPAAGKHLWVSLKTERIEPTDAKALDVEELLAGNVDVLLNKVTPLIDEHTATNRS